MREHGRHAIEKVGKTQPAALLKIIAMTLPREHNVEQRTVHNAASLSNEQLDDMIALLTARVEARAAGIDVPPLIDITPEGDVMALPVPDASEKALKTGKRRINPVLEHAETAVVGRPGYERPGSKRK
jgi:hypothetical protein